MKTCLFFAVASVVAAVSVAEEVHPDWSGLASAGTSVTIPAGTTNLAEEADMEFVNSLPTIVFADASSAIRFTGATPPTGVTFSGKGSIIKDSNHDWSLTTSAGWNFTGNYILKGGIVTPLVACAFGAQNGSTGAHIWVEDGATVKLAAEMKGKEPLASTRIHIKGNGKNGKGAIWGCFYLGTHTYDIRNIILEGDATILQDGDMCYYYHDGTLKMNGHKLTVGGIGDYYFSNCTISGGGEIYMPAATDGSSRTFCVRDDTQFEITDGERIRLSLCDNCEIEYRESNREIEKTKTQQYALNVSGTVGLRHGHQFQPYPFGEYDEHELEFDGPITVEEGSLLRLRLLNSHNCSLKITGSIGGAGNVEVYGQSRVHFANTNNTFKGYLLVTGAEGASLRLSGTNSVPNYSAVTCNAARVALDVKSDGSAWTPETIVKFADEATFLDGGFVSLDASGSEGAAYTLSGEDWSKVANSGLPLSSDGTGTLTVTGPLSDRCYAFGAVDGVLRITGDGPICVTNVFAGGSSSVHSQEVGTVLFDGAAYVNATNAFLTMGSPRWQTEFSSRRGYMAVSNSVICGTLETAYADILSNGGIFPGWYGIGAMTIGEGAAITSNFVVAYGSSSSRGAVYQRGGDVSMLGSSVSTYIGKPGVIGYSGHGYYEVSGGELTMLGRTCVGCANGQGVLSILDGGSVTAKRHFAEVSHDPWLSLSYTGPGHIYIAEGGRLSLDGCLLLTGYYGSYTAHLTLDGGHFETTTAAPMGYANGGKFHINLKGGTLESRGFSWKSGGYYRNTTYMNFNGGTYKARASYALVADLPAQDNHSVFTVYAGGMYVDSNGFNVNVPTPILEAGGMGVASVPLPEGLADLELTGSPFITISGGDGSGAVAYADYDSVAKRVTGVRVICPGHDYASPPTATFKMGGTTLGVSVCTLAANTPGVVVKAGNGMFTLNATNEYSGTTYVKGGTLCAGTDWAISTNSTVVLSGGGVLDFDSRLGKLKDLKYGAGGGSVLNAENAEVPEFSGLELSVDELMAGAVIPLAGTVNLDGKKLTIVGDLGDLDSGSSRRYVFATGTALSGMPVLEGDGLPKGWEIRVDATRAGFLRVSGTTIILR